MYDLFKIIDELGPTFQFFYVFFLSNKDDLIWYTGL